MLTYAVVDRFPLSYLKRAPLGSYSGSSSTRFGLEAFGTHVLVVLYSSRCARGGYRVLVRCFDAQRIDDLYLLFLHVLIDLEFFDAFRVFRPVSFPSVTADSLTLIPQPSVQ